MSESLRRVVSRDRRGIRQWFPEQCLRLGAQWVHQVGGLVGDVGVAVGVPGSVVERVLAAADSCRGEPAPVSDRADAPTGVAQLA